MYCYYSTYPDCYNESAQQLFDNTIEQYSAQVVISSCGFQRFTTKNFRIFRDIGTPDFHILYVSHGMAYFLIHGKMKAVKAGHIVIYHPNEAHDYRYYFADQPEVYWIHFNIHSRQPPVYDFLRSKKRCYEVGLDDSFADLYMKIIHEIIWKKSCFCQMTNAYFQALMTLFARQINDDPFDKDQQVDPCISDSVQYIKQHYRERNPISKYADRSGLSISRFTHKFRLATGMPPVEYITKLRIKEAIILMADADLTISEISDIVGYNSPFYFSRTFKNIMGSPPSQYRKSSM